MGRRKLGPRIVGIYKERTCYRVVTAGDGFRCSHGFPSEAAAQEFARGFKKGLAAEISLTVGALMAGYLESLRVRCAEGSVKAMRVALARLLEASLASPAGRLKVEVARKLYLDLVSSGSATTSHRQSLKAARLMWAWSIDAGLIKGPSPWASVKPVGRIKSSGVSLTQSQWAAALAKAQAHSSPLAAGVELMLLTGMRPSEVLALEQRDIDGRVVFVRAGKTNASIRRAVISEALASRLATFPVSGPRLFDASPKQLATLCRRLTGVRCVDLRKSFATIGVELDMTDLAARMGHTHLSTTKRHYIDGARADLAKSAKFLSIAGDL